MGGDGEDHLRAAVVTGAGPAGLAVAATLGARGIDTLVLEREGMVGARWHEC